MEKDKTYDCAIIGGGLAGLCLSIQLADAGRSVVLFEKNEYPFHKVCGEYISMESYQFLLSLGLALDNMNLPKIDLLGLSSERGFMLNSGLDLGGFGITRYSLDYALSQIAVSKGVMLLQNCKVNKVSRQKDFEINTSVRDFQARLVAGSYGRYTPAFIQQSVDYKNSYKKNKNSYIGVKYHIKTKLDPRRIELHNFKNGYCGISKVDKDLYCLCYLSQASNLLKYNGDIKQMEEQVLYKNPFLKSYFTESEFADAKPLAISNIQFSKKQTNADGIFLLGDAAGSITPLCGNGMSMGMRASKLLAQEMLLFYAEKIDFKSLKTNYDQAWNKAFNTRIKAGFYLQHLFGKKWMTHYTLKMLVRFPLLTKKIISLTHGGIF